VFGGHNIEKKKHNMKHTVTNYQTSVDAKLLPAAVGFGQVSHSSAIIQYIVLDLLSSLVFLWKGMLYKQEPVIDFQ
jgi:hypothetical protein